MTTLWVNRHSSECGDCGIKVSSWATAKYCLKCGKDFTKIGTHFIKETNLIRTIIQTRSDLEWAGVHPERWYG
jgi:hypothetical protein